MDRIDRESIESGAVSQVAVDVIITGSWRSGEDAPEHRTYRSRSHFTRIDMYGSVLCEPESRRRRRV